MQQRRQHIAHQQPDGGDKQATLEQHLDRLPAQASDVAGLTQRGKANHHQHHYNILNDEETDGDAPV